MGAEIEWVVKFKDPAQLRKWAYEGRIGSTDADDYPAAALATVFVMLIPFAELGWPMPDDPEMIHDFRLVTHPNWDVCLITSSIKSLKHGLDVTKWLAPFCSDMAVITDLYDAMFMPDLTMEWARTVSHEDGDFSPTGPEMREVLEKVRAGS